MNKDELWKEFEATGSVAAFLRYAEAKNAEREETVEADMRGTGDMAD